VSVVGYLEISMQHDIEGEICGMRQNFRSIAFVGVAAQHCAKSAEYCSSLVRAD